MKSFIYKLFILIPIVFIFVDGIAKADTFNFSWDNGNYTGVGFQTSTQIWGTFSTDKLAYYPGDTIIPIVNLQQMTSCFSFHGIMGGSEGNSSSGCTTSTSGFTDSTLNKTNLSLNHINPNTYTSNNLFNSPTWVNSFILSSNALPSPSTENVLSVDLEPGTQSYPGTAYTNIQILQPQNNNTPPQIFVR